MELNGWAIGLTILNVFLLLTNLVGLPGNWLMVAGAAVLTWLQWGHAPFGMWTLVATALLALIGEIVEFIAGYAGARRAGTSKGAANLAILGGLIGGFAGVTIPIPFIGPLLGACLGAAAGAIIGETRRGTAFHPALKSGAAAGAGRFVGTVAKLGIGGIIWLILAVAAVVK